MAKRFQQFLGSTPGITVEIIDGEKSPFRVKTDDGFEFWVSGEDFKSYFKEVGSPTPDKWMTFVTDSTTNLVETEVAKEAIDLVNNIKRAFKDFLKARSFLKDFYNNYSSKPETDVKVICELLRQSAKFPEAISDKMAQQIVGLAPKAKQLLADDRFASLDWPLNHSVGISPNPAQLPMINKDAHKKPLRNINPKMKNVEFTVEGDTLTITVNLSAEFGPSKSGKTIIVASTEGNKTVPGRTEKVGLNVYKEPGETKKTGNKKSFKNMEMNVNEDRLDITVDLSNEIGPSKSGKTIIIGTSGGNQLVYGRSEKIGLNVYKAI
ncbi:MAG: hypothetical protein ACP5U1_10955 [Desulfomonilaceae bacterium]